MLVLLVPCYLPSALQADYKKDFAMQFSNLKGAALKGLRFCICQKLLLSEDSLTVQT